MQEKLDALVRTQAMQLFRQQGLHFTMQQVAEPLHISKKTIYTVYPSKEALLLDMVDHAFADIHRCKQEILAGSGTLQEKLRAVIIVMPDEYAALDLRQMKELDEKYPQYGFAKHKGYGTAEHIAALRQYGPCPIHRRSFLKKFYQMQGEETA